MKLESMLIDDHYYILALANSFTICIYLPL